MKSHKRIVVISAIAAVLLVILLATVILALRSISQSNLQESKTTDTWSSDFTNSEEKLAFLAEYLITPGEVLDAEYHIVYHDNSTGLIPGPSDWDVRIALKIKPDELSLWLDGFMKVSSNEVDLSLWEDLSSDTILWNSSNAEYYRREGDFSYLVTFPGSDVILKAVSSMAYPSNLAPKTENDNYLALYGELIAEWASAMQNYKNEDYITSIFSFQFYSGATDFESMQVHYALYDIDGNGVSELILKKQSQYEDIIAYIFTIKDGSPINLFGYYGTDKESDIPCEVPWSRVGSSSILTNGFIDCYNGDYSVYRISDDGYSAIKVASSEPYDYPDEASKAQAKWRYYVNNVEVEYDTYNQYLDEQVYTTDNNNAYQLIDWKTID